MNKLTLKTIAFLLILIPHSIIAQEWEEIALFDSNGYYLRATSELNDPNQGDERFNSRYSVLNVVDGNYATAWVEGANGNGVGEAIYISLPQNFSTITLHSGYGKSLALFKQNNRVKSLKATLYVGINPMGYVTEIAYIFKTQPFTSSFEIELADLDTLQTFRIPILANELKRFSEQVKDRYFEKYSEPIYQMAYILKLEIADVYQGTKNNDTCISEIFFNDSYITDYRKTKFQKVESIYVDQDYESRILIDTPTQRAIPILEDAESTFQVIEVAGNKKWATVIRMPAVVNGGRIETEYLLINTSIGKVMNNAIENSSQMQLFSPFFLVEKHNDFFLEHQTGEIRLK
jgi:hypothetical protein